MPRIRFQVSVLSALLAVASLVGLGACANFGGSLPREEGLHPRLTPFSYIEEGKLISLGVDTAAARRRGDDEFIPFAIGIANIGQGRITLTRESFTLVDDQGRHYPLAGFREVRDAHAQPAMDFRLTEHFAGAFAGRFDAWPLVKMVFFPSVSIPSQGILTEDLQVPRYHWVYDMLYFPHPEGPLLGRKYEILFKTKELKHPIVIKFRIR